LPQKLIQNNETEIAKLSGWGQTNEKYNLLTNIKYELLPNEKI
jgi:hypothetical protein